MAMPQVSWCRPSHPLPAIRATCKSRGAACARRIPCYWHPPAPRRCAHTRLWRTASPDRCQSTALFAPVRTEWRKSCLECHVSQNRPAPERRPRAPGGAPRFPANRSLPPRSIRSPCADDAVIPRASTPRANSYRRPPAPRICPRRRCALRPADAPYFPAARASGSCPLAPRSISRAVEFARLTLRPQGSPVPRRWYSHRAQSLRTAPQCCRREQFWPSSREAKADHCDTARDPAECRCSASLLRYAASALS